MFELKLSNVEVNNNLLKDYYVALLTLADFLNIEVVKEVCDGETYRHRNCLHYLLMGRCMDTENAYIIFW